MAINIKTNMSSLIAQRLQAKTNNNLSTSIQRLSSGKRINSAKDDAAGLAIVARMVSQEEGLNQGTRGALDGISMAQTADGALSSITSAANRMRELAVQAANGSYNAQDRAALDAEYQALSQEIGRIGDTTEFNGLAVVGADAGTQDFQVGADAGQTLSVTTGAVSGLGGFASAVTAGNLTTAADANNAITAVDNFINSLNSERGNLGAVQSQLGLAIENNQQTAENTAAARSRIEDADFARETAIKSKNDILSKAGIAMQTQANALNQNVLNLLK